MSLFSNKNGGQPEFFFQYEFPSKLALPEKPVTFSPTSEAGKPEGLVQSKYLSALPYQPVIEEFPLSYTDEEGGKAFIVCCSKTCSNEYFSATCLPKIAIPKSSDRARNTRVMHKDFKQSDFFTVSSPPTKTINRVLTQISPDKGGKGKGFMQSEWLSDFAPPETAPIDEWLFKFSNQEGEILRLSLFKNVT